MTNESLSTANSVTCDMCQTPAAWRLHGTALCDLHRATVEAKLERHEIPAPKWTEVAKAVAVMSAPVLLFLGGCGPRDESSIDPILYVLAGWLVAIVVVALASDRLVRWIERRADVQTRDESEMESGS